MEISGSGTEKSKWLRIRNGCDQIWRWAGRRVGHCFTMKTLRRRMPIIDWLPRYRFHDLPMDLVAGITVGMTVIPQGIAYANVAKLPSEYGLYSAFMGCFVYCIFGSTRGINIGPTAIMGLVTSEHVNRGGPEYAVLLCFLSGCVQFLAGLFNLGFLVDFFISAPVVSGFCSAAAVTIASTQLKGLMGLTFNEDDFFSVIRNTYLQFATINYWDLLLGGTCIVALFVMRKLTKYSSQPPPEASKATVVWFKFIWFTGVGRNALIAAATALLTYGLHTRGLEALTKNTEVKPGLPPFQVPNFNIRPNGTLDHNRNDTRVHSFIELVGEFGPSLILAPLLGILEHIAIAKVFDEGTLDASQEFFALGLSNILGSFVSSFPATGSFSRSTVNYTCGVKSPIAGIFTGLLVLMALGFIGTTFVYIPKAAMSAIIISAVIFMMEFHMIPQLWKTSKLDLFMMLSTFFSCVIFKTEYGILTGIILSMLALLYSAARPHAPVVWKMMNEIEYIVMQPDRALSFPVVERIRRKINRVNKKNQSVSIIFDGLHVCSVDYTVAKYLTDLMEDCHNKHQLLLFVNLRSKVLRSLHAFTPAHFEYCGTMEEAESKLTGKYSEIVTIKLLDELPWPVKENGNTTTTAKVDDEAIAIGPDQPTNVVSTTEEQKE